jgi:trehalose synthase
LPVVALLRRDDAAATSSMRLEPTSADVRFASVHPARLAPIIGAERLDRLEAIASQTRALLGDRAVVNVNSTAAGGGVAEMLYAILGYARALGIETRWRVISGDPDFFAVTKRVHNGLYGGAGDGGSLGAAERTVYEHTIERNAGRLLEAVRAEDVIVLHDPQTAGLAPLLQGRVGAVIWRCHVGYEGSSEWTDRAWEFVRPYVESVDAFVFSRRSFAPSWMDASRLAVIPPSIDPFTPKNEELAPEIVASAVAAAGLVEPSRVSAPWVGLPLERVDLVTDGRLPGQETPLIAQVSRWDRMKDMRGVLEAFTGHVDPALDAHLVLAGPSVEGVTDDPEGAEVFAETRAAWESLDTSSRRRVHLATIGMSDLGANARVVNALQRHATVVVQKSLAEGFGLTVAEAMWKSRPVVAAAVGGIADQVSDGLDGLLVPPDDLAATGAAIEQLLRSAELRETLGAAAHLKVVDRFLADRHLEQYADLLTMLVAR